MTDVPPLGWNSYDSFGCFVNQQRLMDNLAVFVDRLKPHGYDYFVLDGGWYRQYALAGREFPVPGEPFAVTIDDFGRPQPAPCFFPEGVADVAAACHAQGVKFGIHMMRGIPKLAVDRDTPVAGTSVRARDIANIASLCHWCPDNVGVDVSRPEGRDYYDGLVAMLADWGVDFIKYDDIIPWPDEVDAVVDAIAKCGREIVLSLSPGDAHQSDRWATYCRADQIRITGDIWDERWQFDLAFDRWKAFLPYAQGRQPGFWLDQDMIPFGELCVWNPDQGKEVGWIDFAGKGVHRQCLFTADQKRTFLTMRALGASPLFMGGALTGTDDETFGLLTDPQMLACNQNGIAGVPVKETDACRIWRTPHRTDPASGWIGIFNRSGDKTLSTVVDAALLGIPEDAVLYDIWNQTPLTIADRKLSVELNPDDVLFVRYRRRS